MNSSRILSRRLARIRKDEPTRHLNRLYEGYPILLTLGSLSYQYHPTTSIARQTSNKRQYYTGSNFSTTNNTSSFDTYRLVQRLEADGFTRDSSEAIMNSLSEVITESSNNLVRHSVARSDFEKSMYMNRMDLNQLKSEIQLLEKNDFALIKADLDRLNNEVEKLKVRMTEDLRRAQSNIRLELGLEKGRIRDHQSTQEIRIKETDSKIDAEVSALRTQMETIQWDLFKTLFPLFCAAGALFFSYLRFVK